MTKSPDGKSSIKGRLQASPSGEANEQAVGKRTAISIVKSTTADIAGRAVEDRAASPCSMGEACHSRGSEMGRTREARRCKRRRHARKTPSSIWGDPDRFRMKRSKTIRGLLRNLNQLRHGGVPVAKPAKRRRRNRGGIRSKTESRRDACQGVGDGHSTEEPTDTITGGEGRVISLESRRCEEGLV